MSLSAPLLRTNTREDVIMLLCIVQARSFFRKRHLWVLVLIFWPLHFSIERRTENEKGQDNKLALHRTITTMTMSHKLPKQVDWMKFLNRMGIKGAQICIHYTFCKCMLKTNHLFREHFNHWRSESEDYCSQPSGGREEMDYHLKGVGRH